MRIVGGRLGGRRLVAPRGSLTRPTADRVREALFSALFDVSDLRVLDLYAGCGAVGLEAWSRGAREVTLVETNRNALRAIEQNIEDLQITGVRVQARDVRRVLIDFAKRGESFDLIFADPPYDDDAEVLPLVLEAPLVSSGGRIVLEHRASQESPEAPVGLRHTKTKTYGEAALAFYETAE